MALHLVMRAVRGDGDKPGTTRVLASTDDTDRMGDIVDQASWRLDGFRKNPVILWAHDQSIPPVGRASDVGVSERGLELTIEWDVGTELGATVARQFAEGFLSAVSVGFRPGRVLSADQLGPDDPRKTRLGKYGVVYMEPELLETSAVPVPANGAALAQRNAELVAKGLPAVAQDDVVAALSQEIERLGHIIAEVMPAKLRAIVREEAAHIAAEVVAAQLEAEAAEEPDADPPPAPAPAPDDPDAPIDPDQQQERAWAGWPKPPDPWAGWE